MPVERTTINPKEIGQGSRATDCTGPIGSQSPGASILPQPLDERAIIAEAGGLQAGHLAPIVPLPDAHRVPVPNCFRLEPSDFADAAMGMPCSFSVMTD